MLKYIYQNKGILTIKGPNYTIRINGEDIINYHNEFNTELELSEEENGFSFILNDGNNLCGPISIEFNDDDLKGKYLYLYNEAKDKYNLVKAENLGELKLDTAGKYMITELKMGGFSVNCLLLVLASILLIGLLLVYIVTKKNYWFW